jgi:hypothetical protein
MSQIEPERAMPLVVASWRRQRPVRSIHSLNGRESHLAGSPLACLDQIEDKERPSTPTHPLGNA